MIDDATGWRFSSGCLQAHQEEAFLPGMVRQPGSKNICHLVATVRISCAPSLNETPCNFLVQNNCTVFLFLKLELNMLEDEYLSCVMDIFPNYLHRAKHIVDVQ